MNTKKWALQFLGSIPLIAFSAYDVANANFLQEDVENVESPPAQRFVATNCLSCHSVSDPEADFRIDRLLEQNAIEPNLFQWKEILSRLESRDMPPKGHPRPEEGAYEEAVIRIRSAVERAEEAILAKQPRAMRRLNRDEYANTIRDLFGIRFRPGDDFPADGMLHGFDTVAEGLVLSPSLVERYLKTANTVLERALRPIDSNLQPKTERYAFYEEHDSYPQGTPLSGLGVYNGNAHMTFPKDGKKRVVYIGGPAIFAYRHIDPIVNPVHAFHSEGVYRLKVTLTPQKFEPGDVASFTVLGTDKRRIADIDVTVPENGKPMTFEAECYYDRSESMAGFEIQWTNGNHLQWPSRGRLLSLPFDGSDQNKPWWHINYRMEGNQRVEWKPQTPEELPFSYFEKVELEITGPFLEQPSVTADWLGSFHTDHDSEKVFQRFLPKAFRRPVTAAECNRYVALVQNQQGQGLDPLEALKVGVSAALCSPHFLYLVESPPNDAPHGSYLLNDHEFAARLSYFLWSSCPDDELRTAADSGRLQDPDILDHQVTRMLADPKSNAFAQRFVRQWLNLDKLATTMPEPKLFPNWSDDLRDSSREETLAVFREVLARNLPVTELIASDWTFVNEDLAIHYGLPLVQGRRLRKVALPKDDRRGGLLTHASILTLTSEATRTAPVIRGAYVLDRLFNRPPPPPPANVGALIPDASHAKSVREHLAIHRADPACASCHAKFDGFGLALENFDATGRWRTVEPAYEDPAKPVAREEGAAPQVFDIDTKVEMADGSHLEGIAGMKRYLLSRREDFVRGLTERMTVYACGRGLTSSDRAQIETVVRSTAANDYKLHSMIRAVIDSKAFRTR